MIKKINIIFLLIISFSFCTSVFAEKSEDDLNKMDDELNKMDDELIEECLENKDLLDECEEILGSPNVQY